MPINDPVRPERQGQFYQQVLSAKCYQSAGRSPDLVNHWLHNRTHFDNWFMNESANFSD